MNGVRSAAATASRIGSGLLLVSAIVFLFRSFADPETGRAYVPVELGIGWLDHASETALEVWRAMESFSFTGTNIAVFILLGWCAGRLYLYERFSRISAAERLGAQSDLELMPSQMETQQELERIIRDRSPSSPPLMVALRGSWGSGKSFILETLRSRLETHNRSQGRGNSAIVVCVDIWRHSTETDLHLALFEKLLGHPRVPRFPSLFRYPMTLLPVIFLRYLVKVFLRGRVEVSGVKLVFGLPTALWQQSLESVVAGLRARGDVLVWVLDEIDRCSPPMAQAAITLARRALSLPGSVIVLPYVPEQLRFKVFNPLICGRQDISSTLHAMVTEFRQRHNQVLLGEDGPEFWRQSWAPASMASVGLVEPEEPASLYGHEPAATLERSLAWTNSQWFANAGDTQRLRLLYLFEEKYLSLEVRVKPITVADLIHIVSVFPTLRPFYLSFCAALEEQIRAEGVELPGDGIQALVADDIRAALESYDKEYGGREAPQPSIRHLEGGLRNTLSLLAEQVKSWRRAHGQTSAYLRTSFVTAVLLAYRRAQEIARRRPFVA